MGSAWVASPIKSYHPTTPAMPKAAERSENCENQLRTHITADLQDSNGKVTAYYPLTKVHRRGKTMVALARTSPLKEERPRVAAFPFRGDQSAHRRNRVATIELSHPISFSPPFTILWSTLRRGRRASLETAPACKFADVKTRRRNQQDQTHKRAYQRLGGQICADIPKLSAQRKLNFRVNLVPGGKSADSAG
jgi:hypothetical protein